MVADPDIEAPEPDRLPGAPHPRHAARVFGHDAAGAEFLSAHASGRLHHAWLVTGPRGIGKATLSWAMARFLLATPEGGGLFGAPDSLDIDPGDPVARRMAALSEPRLMLIRRPWNDKTERLATQITIDETRKLKGFFQMSSADGGARAVIVDSADEMNTAASNALLKVLEEPPARAVLFLVSHQPARLLPTIRSRCRTLRLNPLGPGDHAAALAQAGHETEAGETLHLLSEGSAGDAIRLAEAGGPDLYARIAALFRSLPRMDRQLASKLAAENGSEERFDLFLTLTDRFLARLARTGSLGEPPAEIVPGEAETLSRLSPDPAAGRAWAELAQGLTAKARRGRAVNLDPSALILDMCLSIARRP
ncbi:DNA polymerase III subunit delta' [Rhodobacterales bacterium HKCCE2091]|nr:DNA polymerase III subunit delta' [Rhodobacterales bacterium HKCCE2091]